MEHDGEHQINLLRQKKWSKIYLNRLHLKI